MGYPVLDSGIRYARLSLFNRESPMSGYVMLWKCTSHVNQSTVV